MGEYAFHKFRGKGNPLRVDPHQGGLTKGRGEGDGDGPRMVIEQIAPPAIPDPDYDVLPPEIFHKNEILIGVAIIFFASWAYMRLKK